MNKERLSGKQKAAILFLLLGEDITSEVFKRLRDDEVQEITREISLIRAVPAGISDAVAEEFYHMTLAREYITVGGIDYAKKVLIKSMGTENARKIIDRLAKIIEKSAGFSALEKISPQQLSKFIQHEHPQTIALILAHLSPSQAAQLISALPEDIRTEVVIRMANLEEISPEIVKKIAGVLDQKLEALGSYSLEEYGGVKAVSELFNRMDRRASRNVLEQIESRDPGLAVSIKDLMFVFEDILLIDDQGIMEILKRIDKKSLAIALKGSKEELRTKFFKNMSQRAGEMLKEEMEYLGPIRVKDVEKAQHEIVEVVRGLEEEGLIVIGGTGSEEYVI
ncbi:MAG TPA: flagellar motor switch protein FliG [Candidatus Deferrimicrobium sp.]|nr:flagellar motor switch protein FliG [Candidatus Kapabacteria bacterium]HLP60311.1 flagellar motor switch protein FliG [Candidatus Deferrimicrobium sp.]